MIQQSPDMDGLTPARIKARVKSFILEQFLRGEPGDALTDEIRLIRDGIIDSMASLRLVAFLEESFDVSIRASQMDAAHLDTLDLIVKTVLDNKV